MEACIPWFSTALVHRSLHLSLNLFGLKSDVQFKHVISISNT